VLAALALALGGCTSGTDNLANDQGLVDFTDAGPNTTDAGPNGGCVPDGPQCNNCIDDDGDGFIDGLDPECTGAMDDLEESFATGIPGDNRDDKFQDCFFDGNSGGGDDGCRIHTCCLLDECPPDLQAQYDPSECSVTQECLNNCGSITPPGCDCFGCCTVCDDAGCVDIFTNPAVAPDCDGSSIHDPQNCPTCTQHNQCGTNCDDPCVLCPGQTVDDLPPECNNTPECPGGLTVCNNNTGCAQDEFCNNGCCVRIVQ